MAMESWNVLIWYLKEELEQRYNNNEYIWQLMHIERIH